MVLQSNGYGATMRLTCYIIFREAASSICTHGLCVCVCVYVCVCVCVCVCLCVCACLHV
jgi:hypothetical protein